MSATQSFASTNLPLSLGAPITSSSSASRTGSDLFARRLAKSCGDSQKNENQALLAQLNGTPSFEAQRAVAMAFILRRASERSNVCTQAEPHQFSQAEIDESPQDHQSTQSRPHHDSSDASSPVAMSPLTDEVHHALRQNTVNHHVLAPCLDLPMLALGVQEHRYCSPGPAADLASSSADFARELNRWAATPGGGLVYPWSASAATPPSASPQHHFPPSSSLMSAHNRDDGLSVLDPRFGNLTADTAFRMLSDGPDFARMSRAESSNTSNSSEHHSSSHSGFSVSTGIAPSSSLTTSASSFGQPCEPHDHSRTPSPKRTSSGSLHNSQEARRNTAPRNQLRHKDEPLSSVHSDFTGLEASTAVMTSASTAPSKTQSRRTSAVDSNGRYVCRHPGCDKTFSTSGHARRHSHVHSPLCPFICPHEGCDATFSRRDNCTQHQRARHSQVLEAHRLDDQDSG
ncbi:FOG: Zn-finger [Ceraceosorus bombacis]|uniref:FOG: Zn-finger n=1 Tax=Ceraceosorus bombacis TaxID=401625 RepID=A0A0N7LAM1_9BASI|nr:FOG: Zn-finger [Ceraceosorus bombacis]